MIEIAILGYGTVGSGVAEVIDMNAAAIRRRTGQDIHVKRILDVRDFPGDPYADRLTKDADDVFGDPEIRVVVETIGGSRIAYDFTKRALQAGKHVVTSNKELVAAYGPELMDLAHDHGISYLFEASVGGGIPIIRPLHKCLAANEILSVAGILNGTTNYILTRMQQEGVAFDAALREAQEAGYAEKDPTADVEGHDACRKIAILSSIAFDHFVDYRDVRTEGIVALTQTDMAYAASLGTRIKLVASCRRLEDGRLDAQVRPTLIPTGSPLAVADGVFNAILVEGNALGQAMFYGRGAGKLPTASAVVADVAECVMHIGKTPHYHLWDRNDRALVAPFGETPVRLLVRIDPGSASDDPRGLIQSTFAPCGGARSVFRPADLAENGLAFVVGEDADATEDDLRQALASLEATGMRTLSVLKVMKG
jgi:homoserine dehydrogenase